LAAENSGVNQREKVRVYVCMREREYFFLIQLKKPRSEAKQQHPGIGAQEARLAFDPKF
jgi:hypothetical protein